MTVLYNTAIYGLNKAWNFIHDGHIIKMLLIG